MSRSLIRYLRRRAERRRGLRLAAISASDRESTPLGLATVEQILDELESRDAGTCIFLAATNPRITGGDTQWSARMRGSAITALGLLTFARNHVSKEIKGGQK